MGYISVCHGVLRYVETRLYTEAPPIPQAAVCSEEELWREQFLTLIPITVLFSVCILQRGRNPRRHALCPGA
jgi:hypothetical protein